MSKLLRIGLALSVAWTLASSDAFGRHGNRGGGPQPGMRGGAAAGQFGPGNQLGPMHQYRMQHRAGGGQCLYGNQAPRSATMPRQWTPNAASATPYGYRYQFGASGQPQIQNRAGAGQGPYGSQRRAMQRQQIQNRMRAGQSGYGNQPGGARQMARTRTPAPQ